MRIKLLGSVLMCVLFSVILVVAQVTTGTITGTVSDSTGAVIPGATITVRNVETGITRTATSDEAGRYRVPQLAVGSYEITAESAGFQTTVRSGVTLTIGREAVVDFAMQVGAVAERITVTGEAPLLESTKAEISALVDERQVQALPLNGRSFANLTSIQAGVVTDFHSSSDIQRGGRPFVALGPKLSVAGARPNQAAYLLDGTEITSLRYNNIPGSMAGQLLGVEAVREFTVLKNNYGAQYGRAVGGITNAVTRSGTNEIHGSAFEFFRNSALDAKDFFNASKTPTGEEIKTPPLRRNQFGASINGPIVKDKSFFMGSYEGIRQMLSLSGDSTVPTLQSRAGLGPLFGNPTTPVAKDPNIQPFLDLIPLPDMYPDGRPVYPAGAGGTDNGLAILKIFRPRPISEDNGVIRYDSQLSSNDSLFVRLTMDRSSMTEFGSTFIKGYRQEGTGRYYFLTIGETKILSSTLLNDFRAGFARNVNKVDEIFPASFDPRLGVFPGGKIMDFSIGGGVSVAGKIGSGFQEPFGFFDNTFDVSDNVAYNQGNHSINMGGNVKRFRGNVYQETWGDGILSFTNFSGFYRPLSATNQKVQNVTSMGLPGTWDAVKGWRQTYWALYLQDDWKVLPNLTLNLGIRYERITEPKEANDRVSNIRNVLTDKTTTIGYPWIKIEDRMKGFSPRFGMAWTPFGDQKTVIRSGFGVFKEPIMEAHYALYYYTDPFAKVFFNSTNVPFPYPLGALLKPESQRTPAEAATVRAASSVFVEHNAVEPHTLQWNLALERQLTESIVVSGLYIGSRGLHLTTSANPNQFIPIKRFDPTVGYERWYTPGAGEPGGQIRTNPNFEAYRMTPWAGNSWYNGLELELKQRYAKGLQYTVSYTYAKNQSDVGVGNEGQQGGQGSPQNWFDRDAEKSLSGIHVAQNFIVSSTYELPIGSGRAVGANWSGVMNHIFGGWSINGVARRRTGIPVSLSVSGNRSRSGGISASGSISERPDLKPGGNYNLTEGTTAGCGGIPAGELGTIVRYYDPCQFVLPPIGRYGNLAPNTVIGPGLFNMDFSVFKGFRVFREGTNMQFRAEFFNILNHPNFDNPSGQVITLSGTTGSPNTTAGRISSTQTDSRRIQFALKLTF